MNQTAVEMWTVYERPRDFPDGYIARLFRVHSGGKIEATKLTLRAATLDRLREQLPPFLHRLPRDPLDEPQIVETWI